MMLTTTRKSNSYFFRFPALALLVVAAALLVACGGGSDSGGGGNGDDMMITPNDDMITTPPPYGGTQEIRFRTEDNEYQSMEIPVSDVPQFSGVDPTGRSYRATSTDDAVATATATSAGVVTVTAIKRGSATIKVIAEGPAAAASPTLTRSVSAPATRQNITAEYSFMVDVENRVPKVVNPIRDQTVNQGEVYTFQLEDDAFEDPDDDLLSYSAVEQPDASWLTFDEVTRTFSGTPDGTSNDITVTVTAGDNYGGEVTDEFTITVNRPVPAPDLIVPSTFVINYRSARTYTLTTGVAFTLSASVSNIGTGSSAATTLTYYRSSDSTITTGDTPIGTQSVSALDASSGVGQEPISLIAPSSSGTYYYGACVDSVSGESNTSNNCSTAFTVTVTASAPAPVTVPDLIVPSTFVINYRSARTYTLTTGVAFTLSASVSNIGTGSSAATTLTYYRSSDSTITTGDTPIGTQSVSALDASSGVGQEPISLIAPSSSGTYYYGACVDSVSGESNTSNNCSTAFTVTVTASAPAPVTVPDLIIPSISASTYTLTTGAAFTLSATVYNQGTGSSAATTLRYYRSSDSTITTSDTAVGTDSVSTLAASATSPQSISLTAPSSSGTYYYGACVDLVSRESDTSNNCSDGIAVTVEESVIDPYSISVSVSGFDGDPEDEFKLSATVRYSGSGTTAPTTVKYYRSSNSTITSSDTQVGTDSISSRSSPTNEGESINIDAPSSSGTYYYGACAETATRTICSSGVAVTVGVPDLVISSFTAPSGPLSRGSYYTAYARIHNQGTATAVSPYLLYSLRQSSESSSSQVGEDLVSSISVSGTSSLQSASILIPAHYTPGGVIYFSACVTVSGETNTDNNCSTEVAVVVDNPVINPSSISASVSGFDGVPRDIFKLSATVRYSGSGTTARTTVKYYRSSNSTITSSDTQVGTDSISSRSSPTNEGESIDIFAQSSSGTYYYGACAETATRTICSSGVAVTVEEPVINPSSISVSVSGFDGDPEDEFKLSATVRYSGSGTTARTTVKYYRSSNSTITSSDTQVGTDSISSRSSPTNEGESINIDAPSSSGTYYYGACAETATRTICSSGVRVTVEEPAPDLIVSMSVSSSRSSAGSATRLNVASGNTYYLHVMFRNQGSGRASETSYSFYESQALIDTYDTVPELSASGRHQEPIRFGFRTVVPPGTYRYHACVAPVSGESNKNNNCSNYVTVTVR